MALPPRRAVLSPDALARARGAAPSVGSVVAVLPSGFGGLGVFCLRSLQQGELICFFRGAAVRAKDVAGLSGTEQAALGKYLICDSHNEWCCSPLLPGGRSPPPLPAALSGCLINEACHRPEGEYRANAAVRDTGQISSAPCPWLKRRFLDWEVRALRPLVAGEELLICYGEGYSSRGSYRVAPTCAAEGN